MLSGEPKRGIVESGRVVGAIELKDHIVFIASFIRLFISGRY